MVRVTRIGAVLVATVLAAMCVAGPAAAWGPKATVAIATTAGRVLSGEGTVPLANLEKDILRGASESATVRAQVMPLAATDPVGAIQSEMYLLQAVRGERVDPYYAYRLGMLGALVAEQCMPLSDADPAIRNRYAGDVEGHVSSIVLKTDQRKAVEPAPYFERVRRLANENSEVIQNDYRTGLGFNGSAAASFPDDASRAVNAVADVWNTIFRGASVVSNMPEARLRDYVVGAVQYYIARGNSQETEAAYARLTELKIDTPDLHKRIGDMFYDAGLRERAVKEYKAVLAVQPDNKEVAQRVAEYYVGVGDEAMKAQDYAQASAAYATALEADPLHETARGKQIEAQRQFNERQARRDASQKALEDAKGLENEAEREAMRNEFAKAIDLLTQAQGLYQSVSDEFPTEARAAANGLNNLVLRVREYRAQVASNAARLSGGGTETAIRRLAEGRSTDLARKGLEALAQDAYKAELGRLRNTLQQQLQTP